MKPAFLPLLFCPLIAFAAPNPPAAPAAPLAPVTGDAPESLEVADAPPEGPTGRDQILQYGSFELPRVKARSPKDAGGNLTIFAKDEWVKFQPPATAKDGGTIAIGLTNEVARTGRQSIFVDFQKLSRANVAAVLGSQLVAVKPDSVYRVAIWGQVDRKQPLVVAQRLAMLRLQVDLFQEDMETQVDQKLFVQPIPGSRNRPPLFVADRWNQYYIDVKTPPDAHFIRMTWSWGSTPEEGETKGVMFFDDASLTGERVATEELDPDKIDAEPPAAPPQPEGGMKVKPEEELDLTPYPPGQGPPAATGVSRRKPGAAASAKATPPAASKATPAPASAKATPAKK